MGMVRLAIGGRRAEWEVILESSIEVSGESGDVVFWLIKSDVVRFSEGKLTYSCVGNEPNKEFVVDEVSRDHEIVRQVDECRKGVMCYELEQELSASCVAPHAS